MPKDRWRALCDDNPPRKGNDMDYYAGYNRDAVLDAAVRVCMVDPVFDDETWAEFVSFVNPSAWNELRTAVNDANGASKPPKSDLASRILAKRGSTPKPPEPTE